MKLTYYGHSCFSVVIGSKTILFDPFISPNPLASKIDVDSVEADYILLSHGHEDHIADAITIGKRTGATFISAYEIHSWLSSKGIQNTMPVNHGGAWSLDFGTVKFVNAVHSSVLPDGMYGGNPGGFVVQSSEGNFYYAGDTALTMDMKLIPQTHEPLNFCILPIGNVFTMGIEDAILASDFVKCNKVVGVHYDTFDPIKINKEEARDAFQKAGKELLLPGIGEDINI